MNKLKESIWEKYSIRKETVLNMGLMEGSITERQKNKSQGNDCSMPKFINKIRFYISLKMGWWI